MSNRNLSSDQFVKMRPSELAALRRAGPHR